MWNRLHRLHYDLLAFGFGAAPIVAVIAPNGLAVVFVALGIVAVISTSFAPPRHVWLPVIALVLWAAITVIWSPNPREALDGLVRIAATSLLGLWLVSAMFQAKRESRKRIETALMIGMCAAAALLVTQLAAQLVRSSDAGIAGYILPAHTNFQALFNRTMAFLSMLLPIFVLLVWERAGSIAAATVLLIGGGLIFAFNSKAAQLAFGCAMIGFAFAAVFGSSGRRWLAASLAAAILAAPWIAQSDFLRQLAERRDISPSIYHRAAIWEFAAAKIEQAPVFGWGLHASRQMPGSGAEIAPGAELLPLHPHNFALQIWLELGLVGAIVASVLVWILGSGIPSDGARKKAATSVLLAAMACASVGYGLWQGWWMSSLWLLAGLCALEFRDDAVRGTFADGADGSKREKA